MDLLVVTIMESAVGNAEVSLDIVPVRVLAVTLEEAKSSNEIALFQEVVRVGQFKLGL